MNYMESYESQIRNIKLKDLREYYKNKGLTIVGLNDSQGVNTTTLFRKGTLEYLADLLTDKETVATIINAFSLMFNKTEHINYFLEGNLSLEEIKELQVTGMVSALEKVMQDVHLPSFIGKVGYVSKMLYSKKANDSTIHLTDTIRESLEPIIIYSCGANDLMREGWNNPFKICTDYKNKDKNGNYNYTLTKFQDPQTVKRVIGNVERNINNILGLNDKADIYTLGIYVPKSMYTEGMEIFNMAIVEYNRQLMQLCKRYGLQYIDTELTAQRYNTSSVNFHVSTTGHHALAESIIDYVYDRKFGFQKISSCGSINSSVEVQNNGLYDVYINLKHDLTRLQKESVGSEGREKEVYQAKIAEVERQKGVVGKVLTKKLTLENRKCN